MTTSGIGAWWSRVWGLVLLLSMGLGAVMTTQAQAPVERLLQIQDNTVYIDGQAVPSDQLPEQLVLDGLRLEYHVHGMEEPTLQIQGHIYRLTDTTLEPVDASDTRSADIDSGTVEYMDLLRAQSQALYEDVQREYALERAVQQRAFRIRQMEAGAERTAQLDTLREDVSRLFDIKQENRRREIAQLEQQVEAMRQQMEERQAHREAMISQRIQHLVHGAEAQEQP